MGDDRRGTRAADRRWCRHPCIPEVESCDEPTRVHAIAALLAHASRMAACVAKILARDATALEDAAAVSMRAARAADEAADRAEILMLRLLRSMDGSASDPETSGCSRGAPIAFSWRAHLVPAVDSADQASRSAVADAADAAVADASSARPFPGEPTGGDVDCGIASQFDWEYAGYSRDPSETPPDGDRDAGALPPVPWRPFALCRSAASIAHALRDASSRFKRGDGRAAGDIAAEAEMRAARAAGCWHSHRRWRSVSRAPAVGPQSSQSGSAS